MPVLVIIAISLLVLLRLIEPKEALKKIGSLLVLIVAVICMVSIAEHLWAIASVTMRALVFLGIVAICFLAIRRAIH